MELNELMIDDLVSYKGKMSCKITAICKDTAVVDNSTEQDWRIDYNKLIPIPLTTEILEKIGFWYERNVGYVMEEYEYEIIYSLWDHKLRILKNREQILNLEYFDEMCLHELQHVLRLCNIEKTIEL